MRALIVAMLIVTDLTRAQNVFGDSQGGYYGKGAQQPKVDDWRYQHLPPSYGA